MYVSHADFALPSASWKADSEAPRMYRCGAPKNSDATSMPISRRQAASVMDMTSGVISLRPIRSAVRCRFAIRSTGTMPKLCSSRSRTSQPPLVSTA
jgi:hypothetical protein